MPSNLCFLSLAINLNVLFPTSLVIGLQQLLAYGHQLLSGGVPLHMTQRHLLQFSSVLRHARCCYALLVYERQGTQGSSRAWVEILSCCHNGDTQ